MKIVVDNDHVNYYWQGTRLLGRRKYDVRKTEPGLNIPSAGLPVTGIAGTGGGETTVDSCMCVTLSYS